MQKFIERFSFNQVSIVFILLSGVLALQQILLHHINNYLIFSKPFFNLLAGNDLYQEYPQFYYDTFKYSPAFALLFAPMSLLPDYIGPIIWNLLNETVFVIASFKAVINKTFFAVSEDFAFGTIKNRRCFLSFVKI